MKKFTVEISFDTEEENFSGKDLKDIKTYIENKFNYYIAGDMRAPASFENIKYKYKSV